MKKITVCLCAACGAGKSTLVDYMRDNNMSDGFCFVDVDETGLNWWDYAGTENPDRYTEDSIKRASEISGDKNLFFGSCMNPQTLFEKITLPDEIAAVFTIALTSSPEEITKRLKARDSERMCGSDEFIAEQIAYNAWLIRNSNKFQLHVDNRDVSVSETAETIKAFLDVVSTCRKFSQKKFEKFLITY